MDSETEEKLFPDQSDSLESEDEKFENEEIKDVKLKKSETELLGSVKTTNCPGVRTSARVIQKMKQDQTRSVTPPPDKKDIIKDEKNIQKAPIQAKSSRVVWSNAEKNLFFDALNEFGRDFESISNFINSKLKRKNASDQGFKSKEQVRQTFYQTFHKVSKFVKFSDEVKKPAQELYALINYGEMRRRLTFVSEKNLMKIRDLIYKGYATLRCKGKTVRIKTPSCKALRKLNQLEDWLEDIKLPNKVDLYLRPATMESWGRVQNLAQNPVVRASVPLQKKLSSVIRTFQYRWRGHENKINEEVLKLIGSGHSNDPLKNETQLINVSETTEPLNLNEPLLNLTPHQNAVIHRPLVSITEYLSSFNICLNAYEERIGVKIRGEILCHEKHSAKRQRSDSGCEKRSPEHKKCRVDHERFNESICDNGFSQEKEDKEETKYESNEILSFSESGDYPQSIDYNDHLAEDKIDSLERQDSNDYDCMKNDISDGETSKSFLKDSQAFEILSSISEIGNKSSECFKQQKKKEMRYSNRKRDRKDATNLRPLISENIIKKIRKGWTILNCGDISIGDLYVAFGQDSKIMFEYNWVESHEFEKNSSQQNGVPYTGNNNGEEKEIVKQVRQSSLGNKLKHLLLIAHLSENVRRKPCYCGHSCEKTGRSVQAEEIPTRTYVSNKTFPTSYGDNVLFRHPTPPIRRNPLIMDTCRRLSNGSLKYKPRFGSLGSKQIVVKRFLPVQDGVMPEIEVKTVQNHFSSIQRTPEHSQNEDSDTDEDEDENDDGDSEDGSSRISSTLATINSLESSFDKTDSSDITIKITEKSSDSERNIVDASSNLCETNSATEPIGKDIEQNITEKNNSKNNLIFDDRQNTPLDEVPDLSQLMELSLSASLPITPLDESTSDIIGNIPPLSPMQIIRETVSDPKWLEDNMNDFSLSSFLGHLDEISSRDGTESTNMSLNESSIDYMRKFADIAASMQNDEKET